MKKTLALIGLVLVGASCRAPLPRGPRLAPTGALTSLILPPPPAVTLFWTNQPIANLVVSVRQSPDPAAAVSNWTEVARVTGTNAITVPIRSSPIFFTAVIVSETMTVAWDYPPEDLTPDLSFNLYWQPDGDSTWMFAANVPFDSLTTTFIATVNSGRFALTATNSTVQAESDFSNVVAWTNSVGQSVPLQIRMP